MPGSVTVTVGPATFSSVAYATASDYQTLAPGSSLAVTVTLSGVGGTTIKTGTISVSAGTVYTLVVSEPTVSPRSRPTTSPAVRIAEGQKGRRLMREAAALVVRAWQATPLLRQRRQRVKLFICQ